MPIVVAEKFESRRVTEGVRPTAELDYLVSGTNDDREARSALVNFAPSSFDLKGDQTLLIPLETLSVRPAGPSLWDGTMRYSMPSGTFSGQGITTLETIEIGGSTERRLYGVADNVRYGSPLPPDVGNAIECGPDGIRGVDVIAPTYRFTERRVWPSSFVTTAYKSNLFYLTGKVNAGAFRIFAAGECLFEGCVMQQNSNGTYTLTYRFGASPNLSGLSFRRWNGAVISGVSKGGWEYIWFTQAIEASGRVKGIDGVYVSRPYDSGNFGLLGI